MFIHHQPLFNNIPVVILTKRIIIVTNIGTSKLSGSRCTAILCNYNYSC